MNVGSVGVPWQVWVDTGGTFTDCLALDPEGTLHRAKVLSSSALRGTVVEAVGPTCLRVRESWDAPPDFVCGFVFRLLSGEGDGPTVAAYHPDDGLLDLTHPLSSSPAPGTPFEVRSLEEAPLLAARLVTRTPAGVALPPLRLRLATTRGTNALLTRGGVAPALFVTSGFGDLLEIGTQQRADLFALDILKPAPLYASVTEVQERLAADGMVLRPLDAEGLRTEATRLVADGIRTAAVVLLHSYVNPAHEWRVGEILREAGFTHVSLSSDLAPFIKALPRAQTAVVNAYLAPILDAYFRGVAAGLSAGSTVHVMTSAGGLAGADTFHAKDSLLSGPAGGIVGAAAAGHEAGYKRIIAFDMGGTSTDVARYDGDFEYVFEHRVGDAHLVVPALAIESVAAGGGSVCVADRNGLRVGPESAGASPGPACYSAGGPLTVTDVNLLLGRLLPDRFEIPLISERAEEVADALLTDLGRETGERQERDAVLEGLLEIANERMADAIRRVSLRRGYDPAEYALVSFGGAGGQHACAVASRLGIRTVLVPRDASLLSALGIGRAAIERFAERQVLRLLHDITDTGVASLLDELAREATAAVAAEGVALDTVTVYRRIVALRLVGQESTLAVGFEPAVPLAQAFVERYIAVYGHRPPAGKRVEVESARVVAGSGTKSRPHPSSPSPNAGRGGEKRGYVRARFRGAWADAAVYEREALTATDEIAGPALLVERHSVVVVEPGWTAEVDVASGALKLAQASVFGSPSPNAGRGGRRVRAAANPVQEELFTGRFAAIAEEMGEMLQRTALSTNVKERLDFSCALLGPDGDLVASAAHIPVHLGALGVCVRILRGAIPMGPSDVIVTNHPGFGGSHLPDVTVVTPVYGAGDRLIGYVASRAHHAEIGGKRPGSMPPDATMLAEEGVVIPPMYLVRAGEAQWDAIAHLLAGSPFPSRAAGDNLADLEAALAANRRGGQALAALAERHGEEAVWHFMAVLTERAERLLRRALAAMPDGRYAATEHLDDGSPLAVAVTITGDAAEIDFAGTAATHSGNLNAPPAVITSAVLYVLRLLVGEPLPLNEGLLRPITLRLPENALVNPPFDLTDPARCPAVVGGNTEVSQRIVDTLLKALGLAACSQGTMNNILWGTDAFGYYETVCGGAGATANAPGAHAVHTHMTNTRITDPEIIERRYPVRVERFARRHGSGGAGRHPGGDGVVRETTFLAPMALSVLTQHRTTSPYGFAGGDPGQPGRQILLRASGETVELRSTDGADVQTGDRLLLETPGGGGWGETCRETLCSASIEREDFPGKIAKE